jgi:hypothetical protein
MRLSEWAKRAPHKDSMAPKVLAVLKPVLTGLGAKADPSCWVAWGDDPAARYTVLVATAGGLVQAVVRVMVPQEGPRVGGKLLRWNRVQTGELAIDMAAGHRLVSFQIENVLLRGADDEGDAVSAFALEVYAAMDGQSVSAPPRTSAR